MRCLLEGDSTIKDIFDAAMGKVSKIFNSSKSSDSTTPYLKGSISSYSKDLVMTFPTLCDNSLLPETASMISRAHERNLVTMMQLLFSSAQFQGKEGAEILASIHKNIDTNLDIDEYIDAIDGYLNNLGVKESAKLKREINVALTEMVNELKKPGTSFPVESLSETSLNDYTVYNNTGKYRVVKEAKRSSGAKHPRTSQNKLNTRVQAPAYTKNPSYGTVTDVRFDFTEDDLLRMDDDTLKRVGNLLDNAIKQGRYENIDVDYNYNKAKTNLTNLQYDRLKNEDPSIKRDIDTYTRDIKQMERDKMRDNAVIDKKMDVTNLKLKKAQLAKIQDELDRRGLSHKYDDNKDKSVRSQIFKAETDFLRTQLLDTDVKKANEMAPTLMIVRFFKQLDGTGSTTEFEEKAFVTGVKSRLISVDSFDIIERVVAKNKTKINFLNFIRATTGEIKFLRDFIFCVDQAKIDAKNAVKRGPAAKMWKVLETRSMKNNINKIRKSGNDASAITTLVINQETVNILKKEYNIDLEMISTAKSLLDTYNLLGIIIADESIEVVKVLYAGNSEYEQQAYSYLRKEATDNSYKKIINLLNKQGR